MLKIAMAALVSVLACNLFTLNASAQTERSAFTDIQYDNWPQVVIEHEGNEYNLLSVNGVSRANIMKDCKEAFAVSDCRELFALNFTEVMRAINMPVGDTVNLKLYQIIGHIVSDAFNVSVTEEKMQSIQNNREARGE